jgi:hypothetical protein
MIEAEFCNSVAAMTAADFESLEALGAGREIVSGMFTEIPPVGTTKAQTFKDGSWQPSDHGKPHYVCSVIDGDLIDLIAWGPSDPSKMYHRTGIATMIGIDAIAKARWADEPVFAFSDPLEWLRGDCRGVVPVRFDTDLAIALGSVDIVAQTPALARRIKSAFALPEPKISHMKLQEAA